MDLYLIINSFPKLLSGAMITVAVTIIAMILGLVLGLLAALAKMSKNKILNFIANQYIDIIRGTPLLVQLFLIYYGLPQIGISIDPFPSAILGLGINTGAYVAEAIRSGILSIDKGQHEATKALGLTNFESMRLVIIPQAVKTMIPPIGNQLLLLIKDSSLISVITVVELTRTAQQIISTTYKPIELYLAAAFVYYLISMAATKLLNYLERRARVSD